GEERAGLLLHPAGDLAFDPLRIVHARSGDPELVLGQQEMRAAIAVGVGVGAQGDPLAEEADVPAVAVARRGPGSGTLVGAPLRLLLQDPLMLLEDGRLDFPQRHPGRRGDGEAAAIDLEPDRAARGAAQGVAELVRHRAALDQQEARPLRPGTGAKEGYPCGSARLAFHREVRSKPGSAGGIPGDMRSPEITVIGRADPAHFRLDPLLDLASQLLRRLSGALDRLSNGNRYQSWFLDKFFLWPEPAGVDRDGDHGHAGPYGEPRPSGLVLALGTGRRAGPLGKDDHPAAAGKLLASLAHHRLEGRAALAAVDVDHLQQPDAPSEERHVEQLALEDEAELARQVRHQEEGLPGGLMLGEHDRRTVGQVLPADDLPAHAAEPAARRDHGARPLHGDPVADRERQRRAGQADEGPWDHRDQLHDDEEDRTQPDHRWLSVVPAPGPPSFSASRMFATAARSSATLTAAGERPAFSVSRPWPLRTSQVRQPAERPASTSAAVSPTMTVSEGRAPKRSISSSSIPGLGLRHRSEEHTSELQSRENIVCRLLLE